MKKLVILSLILALSFTVLTAKILADTANGQVTIANSVPSVGTVTLWNQASADAAISLTTGSTVTVSANVTITDANSGGDISSANATLYHSTSNSSASDDENIHLINSSCQLGSVVGNTKVATCKFTMNYMALNGTWTVNITAFDASNASNSNTDTNTVNDLAGLDVTDTTIDFSSLALGANSSSATTMTVRNLGNIVIDSQFSGTNYSCTSGAIAAGNTRYSLNTGNYDSMSTNLTEAAATQTSFDLGIRGVATANSVNSDKSEYWAIITPSSGISGTCTNTLTVDAIAS